MPRRNQPNTLRESAMITITIWFDRLCYHCSCKEQMKQMIENDSFLDIEGPFNNMPSSILGDMLEMIESGKTTVRLQRKHLHALILPHLDKVKLPPTLGANSFAFDLILKRCKKLRHLNISYLSHVNPTVLMQIIPNLTHLTTLNMKMIDIPDQVLTLIGKHCPELRELNISHCPITSSGICSLCCDQEEQKIQCTKLLRLNVVGCMVSADTIAYLIQIIPTLRELEYENTFRVFNILNSKRKRFPLDSSPQVFYLNQLTSTDDAVSVTCADAAVTLCPFVMNVTISNSVIENEALYKLMNIQNLLHLRLTNNNSLSLDFHEGVLPILTICGHQLESLLLTNFTVLDIIAIGESCPKLKNLAFSDIRTFKEILYPRENLFKELTALEIWTTLQDESLTSVILKQLLLYCTRLQNLLVTGSQVLSDKLLAEIWRRNEMQELSRLTIENCPNITKFTFDTILDMKNQLVLIRVWSCFLITKEDFSNLQKRIQNENCDTYLEWYSWCG